MSGDRRGRCGRSGGRMGWRWACCVWAVLLLATPTLANWDEHCPQGCKCTYASNRKFADCREAKFSTVPLTLSKEIQELNLNGNNIRYLEKGAFRSIGLINLQKLYLNDNQIQSLNKDAFRDLSIMIELDLSHNRIDKLHPDTFTGLEKLRVLDLSFNLLSRFNGVQFPPLPHLRKLRVQENRLTYIHNYALSNLKLLDSLRLSGNELKLIQPELFINNSRLVELELHDNLWECDCRLKRLVHWAKNKQLIQKHVTCHSPERVSGRKWTEVTEEDLACRPELEVLQGEVPASLGQNASLTCSARGDPLPQVKWVLHGRVLTNMSMVRFSSPEQRYLLREAVEGSVRQTSLTVTHVALDDFTYYTCVADNRAGLVEQNVTLVHAVTTEPGAITPDTGLDLYIIIGAVAGGVLLLVLLILLICCCVKRRQRQHNAKPRPKVNGVASSTHMKHENVLIVNPVEKPPRKYEKVPQTDLELTALTSDPGAHRSYDEVDYPEAGPALPRSPLATLEEEDDDLPSHDTTLPMDAVPGSGMTEYFNHYPDLVDMTRPRAVSPTQLSYHSIVPPQFTTPGEWRYSYAHPPLLTDYTQYPPVAYVSPNSISQQRPGYVTLPRRHRSPSWAGHPLADTETSPPAPASEDGVTISKRFDPIYDTLGPRTTADGTSRTDLTRAALKAVEPFTPRTSQSPSSPPSLPPYYSPLKQSNQPQLRFTPRNQSSTLPRSTPNLLEGSGLSLPPHEASPTHMTTPSTDTAAPRTRLNAHSPTPSNASTLRTSSPHQLNNTKTRLSSSNDSTLDSTHNNNNNNTKNGGKKVPPKPPPKPIGKRLSTSSITSEPRKSSVNGDGSSIFQDEGPDGTEV